MVQDALKRERIELVREFALPLQSRALTHLLNVPESEVSSPFCWPRMETDTWLSAVSFSPITLPLTVALFFCATETTEKRRKKAISFRWILLTAADLR